MAKSKQKVKEAAGRLVGYLALVKNFCIEVPPNWHTSKIGQVSRQIILADGRVEETYHTRYWPGDETSDHLEFALKYDGINLIILSNLFEKIDTQEILSYIQRKPTGKYARRIWFLYEFLTGKNLPLEDLTMGNYVDLLDADNYYVLNPGSQIRRQRINNNLLGDIYFCPIVRRTDKLNRFEKLDLTQQCQNVLKSYPPELLRRALSYLYTKETKSSFEIEKLTPSSSKVERFAALLQLAEQKDFCQKELLIELQNRVVDARFCEIDYRKNQNYIGETVAWKREKIHYVCPKPEDLPQLMSSLVNSHQLMAQSKISTVVHAAVISYGFVFMHPFEDGNGRIHRFLIHNILALGNFTPKGIMFPVSAAILKNLELYDASLESVSQQIMPLVEYSLDEQGCMQVHNASAKLYQYLDMTMHAEILFEFIERTVNTELSEELDFLANYERTKVAIKEIVDLPDRDLDLLIRFCLQNNGKLSSQKREKYFAKLSTQEISQLEDAVRVGYGRNSAETEN